jgi:hypothetical protein
MWWFGRKKDPVLEQQRAALASYMTTVKELEDRIRTTEALKATFKDVWQHDARIAEFTKSLGIVRQLGEVQATRLNIASAAISNFDSPLLAGLDRIDAIFVAMDDMVGDLATRRAALTTGLEEFARRPLPREPASED